MIFRMADGTPYVPLPKQQEFHQCAKKYKAYVGGFGSGKTICGCVEAIKESVAWNNNFGVICRKTYQELRQTTVLELIEFLSVNNLLIRHNKSDHIIITKNIHNTESKILYLALEGTVEAMKKIDSLNLGWFYIDEGSEIAVDYFRRLMGRLRRLDSKRVGWITGNPEGHNWIWSYFHPEGTDHESNKFQLIHAPSHDNIYLPDGYLEDLIDTYPEVWVDRYVYGSFDAFSGLVYPTFSEHHHVVEKFDIPRDWRKVVALDHGLNNPTGVLWMAIDRDDNVYIYDEHKESGEIVSYHADIIKNKSGADIDAFIIDPSCKQREGIEGRTVIGEYQRLGLNFMPGNNDIQAGINRCSEFLKIREDRMRPNCVNRPLVKPSPKLFVFKSCQEFIKEIQDYKWDEWKTIGGKNEPEKPRALNDHLMDAWRYGMMFLFPPTAEPHKEKTNWEKDKSFRPERLSAWLQGLKEEKKQVDSVWARSN